MPLLAVMPLAIAACASSGSSSGGTTDSSTAKGSPIVLYTITDENTNFQNEPELYGGAQAAALAINKAGGINGHQVVIKNCNEQAQAQAAAQCARQAVSDHAAAVVGYSETQGDAIDPILQQAMIPMVGNVPNQSDDLTSTISFPFQASIADNASAVAMQYAKDGYTKIGLLLLNNPLAVQLADQVDAVIAKLTTPSGQKLTSYRVTGPLTAPDYSPYVASFEKHGVQGVILLTAGSAGAAAITASHQAGYKMVFGSVAADFTKSAVLGPLGSNANGFISTSSLPNPMVTSDLAGLEKFKTDMANAAKDGIANTGSAYYDDYSLNAWLAVYAVQEAAQHISGDVTSKSLYHALQTAKGLTLQGLTPPWTPSKAGPPSEPRVSNATAYASVYNNSNYRLLSTTPFNVGILEGASS
jgi:ABC-type branched-subunit amino acid transport system substrate-binding protein